MLTDYWSAAYFLLVSSIVDLVALLGKGYRALTFAMTPRYAHLSPDRLRDAVASLDRPAEAPAQHTVSTKMVESPASSA